MKLCWILIFALMSSYGHTSPTWEQQREEMVDSIKSYRTVPVTDKKVLAAMRAVPRHQFVPVMELARAYRDGPLPIGYGQTISQPYIVALMTQLAELNKESRVLEIGTGSGYQAAVLAELSGHVYTIEIVPELAVRSEKVFKQLNIPVKRSIGDGYFGLKEQAPFDRIVVTAAAAHIPSPLLSQLKPGGKMVIPVGPRWGAQFLLIVSKGDDGKVTTRTILPVRFVPLVGGKK